ncbi:hypothetical protein HAX54_008293 [Datura stramonium]|uniref:RING-type domain-containing protein n=1 Tax=Datura stramonium TaxID=4076 RepID=A0ABS8RV84_DATST|nr:hypothetical protein [Datura stramonium]
MELAIGINASIHSAKENKTHHHHHGQSSGVKNENDWCNNTDDSAHNGWGSLVRSEPMSKITNHDWTDDRTKVQENGWGSTADQRRQQSLPRAKSSEVSCNGWIDEPAIEEYNGWAVPEPQQERRDAASSADFHHQGWGNTAKEKTESSGVSSCEVENTETREGRNNPAFDFAAPSAPPVPEEVHYPDIDLSPLHLSNPPMERKTASVTTQKDNKHEPALCIICWEVSVEGACVPCGHMVGCMQCLNQIKSKKGECPICRVKINQVIKLYSV